VEPNQKKGNLESVCTKKKKTKKTRKPLRLSVSAEVLQKNAPICLAFLVE
jgi:hypothetical protein